MYAHRAIDDTLAAVDSRPEGLRPDEVVAARARFGSNSLPVERTSPWALVVRQFQDVLVFILVLALAVSIATPFLEGGPLTPRSFLDAIVIGAILVLNAALGFVQEYRAEQAIAELQKLSSPRVRVRRDGRQEIIASPDLVPGDIVLVEAGDRIAADARLLRSAFLEADESSLTGESLPDPKDPAPVPQDTPLAEQSSMLWTGTLVTAGSGEAVVVATGTHTQTGLIAELVGASKSDQTPLERRLQQLGRTLGLVALAMCAVVFAVGMLRQLPLHEILLIAISLAVSAVPEGLPAVVTLCFAMGVRRMVAKRAIVRRLDALETLGQVSVICTDKTGTITENRMTVVEAWVPPGVDELDLATALSSCNHAELPNLGNPTELALVLWAEDRGAPRLPIDEEEQPFSSVHKFMQTRHGSRSLLKGSPERILGMCQADADAHAAADQLAGRGLRVLAGAALVGGQHHLLGVVGMEDPPREGVREAVAQAARAGVRTVMITGDNLRTAQAVAAAVGIEGQAIEGRQLDALDAEQLAAMVDDVAIYARVTPQHKVAICEALLARGHVVAMSGDGVNDAPALKRAHVGVAMGQRGTEVAREAASIVLEDDHFATIVAAIAEGRRIHDNIRRFVVFLLRANFDELLLILTALALGLPLPLLPIHILWINLATDGLPALALGTEPAEADVMERDPRPPQQSLLHGETRHLLVATFLGFSGVMATYLWLLSRQLDIALVRTTVLTLTILIELLMAMSARSRLPIWRVDPRGNPWMLRAVAVVLGVHLLLLYTPAGGAFGFVPLPAQQWPLILGVGAAVLLAFELTKAWALSHARSQRHPSKKRSKSSRATG